MRLLFLLDFLQIHISYFKFVCVFRCVCVCVSKCVWMGTLAAGPTYRQKVARTHRLPLALTRQPPPQMKCIAGCPCSTFGLVARLVYPMIYGAFRASPSPSLVVIISRIFLAGNFFLRCSSAFSVKHMCDVTTSALEFVKLSCFPRL